MSTEPTHFLTLMNNCKAFSSLDDMAFSYQCSDQFQFPPGHWQPNWVASGLKKPSQFLKKSQIPKKKMNGGIVELLIPALNKIIRNQDNYFVVIINNRLKIISVHGAPLKYRRIFSKKMLLMRGQKVFRAKKLWKGCSKLDD